MSPFTMSEKIFDKLPPGQQPQMSTVMALMGCSCRILAKEKAVRGIMQNWASSAMATPFGLTRCALILEISIVQPREIIVMKRMVMVKTLMAVFMDLGMSRMAVLLLAEMPLTLKVLIVPAWPVVTFIVAVLPTLTSLCFCLHLSQKQKGKKVKKFASCKLVINKADDAN